MENFSLPESFDGLSNEELSALIDQARSEFNGLNASDDVSDETLERMESLANAIETIQTEKIRRVEAAAWREELSARVAEEVEEPVVEETEVEVTEAATEEDSTVELAKAPPKKKVTKAEDAAEDAKDGGADEDTETMSVEVAEDVVTESTLEIEKESVVAASPNTSIPEKNTPQVLIAAAQDVPQFYVGQRLDPSLLADALHNKARMLSDSRGNQTVYPVATIERPFGQGYDLEGLDQASTWDTLAEMTKPSALVAAGGWCAPSELVYDLFEVECENDVLFSLPTFRVTRGGIRWPVFVPHDETLNPGFTWTEANDIAATGSGTKPCVRIPCPTFTECRLDAIGLCITAGNLIDRAYPEQVRWFINRAIRAYERNNSIRKLNLVIADTVPVSIAATFGAASAIISAILLQAASYRMANGLCATETLDVVAPYWLTNVVKADLARQEIALVGAGGGVATDADVSAFFSAAGLNLRYISHWQNFAVGVTLVWPASVQLLIGYPGSYVEFNQGRLDLGVIRDSVLNSTNDYTAVWFEEFYCVGRRGPQHRLVTIPICPNGAVGPRIGTAVTSACPTG